MIKLEERCWFCKRGKKELIGELPEEFWDEEMEFFSFFEFMGKMSSIEKYRKQEKQAVEEGQIKIVYIRPQEDDDLGLFNLVTGKKARICVCAICKAIGYRIGDIVEDYSQSSERKPYSSKHLYPVEVYERKIDELLAGKKQKKESTLKEYPQSTFVVLNVIKRIKADFAIPLSLIDENIYSEDIEDEDIEEIYFDEETIEKAIRDILKKRPEIGKYDFKTKTFIFSSPEKKKEIDNLIREFSERDKHIK